MINMLYAVKQWAEVKVTCYDNMLHYTTVLYDPW